MVSPAKWDAKSQRIKGASDSVNADNRKLSTIKLALEQIFELNLAKGRRLTAKQVVDIYHGKGVVQLTFSELCKQKIEHLRSLNRKPATIEIHEKCHRYFQEYLGEDMPLENIDRETISGLWNWLKRRGISKARPGGYDHDYVNKTYANCKSLFIFADDKGYIEKNPFGGRLTWEDKEDTDCPDDWVIEKLQTIEWSPKVQQAVDSFLFMCYQGLHISDYRKLKPTDTVVFNSMKSIRMPRTKNGQPIFVPIHNETMKIIEKYGGVENLPRISGQKNNDFLALAAISIGYDRPLTNKRARKKFTDRCLNDYGFSLETVAAMLGHKTTKWVRKYAKVKERRIISEWKEKVEVA